MARPRGAFPSPKWKAFAAPACRAIAGIPAAFSVIPPTLNTWGNTTYGDCVSAEEGAKLAQYSVMCGLSEVLCPDAILVAWARKHGFLNGANLTDVMDAMISDGIAINGITYKDGPYQSVDWTNDAVLSSAIFTGPVKIAVAASQLEDVVTDSNGWWGTQFKKDHNSDHCVNLCGFGSASAVADIVKTSPPSGFNNSSRCYLLFTWGTIGVIDQASMEAITDEAWLRSPSTVGEGPAPTPSPIPPTPPTPPVPPVPPSPSYPMSGVYQVGVYQVNWAATLNDPPPPADL